MSHVTRTPLSRSKGQGHQAALVGCTGRPTWTYSNGHLSDEFPYAYMTYIRISVYRVTTCRPGRGHIVAAARLQLVFLSDADVTITSLRYLHCALSCAVYCNRPCLFLCLFVGPPACSVCVASERFFISLLR